MGWVPVGVEGINDLPFQGSALRGRWPITLSLPYLRPSKDPVYSSQPSGLDVLPSQNSPCNFALAWDWTSKWQYSALTTVPPAQPAEGAAEQVTLKDISNQRQKSSGHNLIYAETQHLVKLQICFEVSLVYLTILEAAPTVTICDGALESVLRVMAP